MTSLMEDPNEQIGVSEMGGEEVQGRFTMTDGFSLFYRRWRAVGEVKRLVICLHGMGVHSEFFRVIGEELAADGAEVYALDARGFGNSTEQGLPRGDSKNLGRSLRDIDEVVEFVRNNHPAKKIFMFGHSLGATETLWYAANHPASLNGIILAAPPIVMATKPPLKDIIQLIFLRVFAPKTMWKWVEGNPEQMKETEEFNILVNKIMPTDPLLPKEFSVRYMFSLFALVGGKALKNASQIRQPTLVIQGDADRMVVPSVARKLLEKLRSEDKSLRTFPQADHFFHGALTPKLTSDDNPDRACEVIDTVSDWLSIH